MNLENPETHNFCVKISDASARRNRTVSRVHPRSLSCFDSNPRLRSAAADSANKVFRLPSIATGRQLGKIHRWKPDSCSMSSEDATNTRLPSGVSPSSRDRTCPPPRSDGWTSEVSASTLQLSPDLSVAEVFKHVQDPARTSRTCGHCGSLAWEQSPGAGASPLTT